MRILFSILLLSIALKVQSQYSMQQIRDFHQKAYESEEEAIFFADYMEHLDCDENIVLDGYKAISKVFLAKSGWNPYKKYNVFKEGSAMLDQCIEKDKSNVELRFLRYAVQSNAPSFLGYSGNIAEDKKIILGEWPGIDDSDLKIRIKNYMMKDENLNNMELSIFQNESNFTNTASAG